jgi:hypothetical protein
MLQRRRQSVEKAIHSAVIDRWLLLGVKGSLVATIPNEGAFGQPGLTKGLFDLIVLSPTLGRLTGWLELKKPDGALSAAQKEFRALLLPLGVPHAVAYDVDQAARVLEEWGAIRPVAVSSPTGGNAR